MTEELKYACPGMVIHCGVEAYAYSLSFMLRTLRYDVGLTSEHSMVSDWNRNKHNTCYELCKDMSVLCTSVNQAKQKGKKIEEFEELLSPNMTAVEFLDWLSECEGNCRFEGAIGEYDDIEGALMDLTSEQIVQKIIANEVYESFSSR